MFGRRKEAAAAFETPPAPTTPRLAPRSPSEAIKPVAPPPPPPPRVRRPRGGLLSALSAALTLLLVLALTGLVGVALLEREVTRPGPLPADKAIVIPRNSGVTEIAALLRREGVIDRPVLFEAYALLNRRRGPLRAGEYLFRANASVDAAIDTLIGGRAILHAVTVPEGLTSEQIVARLRDNETLVGEVAQIPPEGSLLPDTYRFERGMTRQQIVNLMQAKQREALTQIWSRRAADLPIKTPQELVILASIVEKETGRSDERGRVAGVFVNRLNKRMRLQSDPTIVYGLVGGKGTLGRGILRSEIEKPTPYNTYVIPGLPPGPIANPGRAAMEAVANPVRTKDLSFVADGTGGHSFAEDYEQHQRNVMRWRQIERARATTPDTSVDRAEPAPETPAAPAGPAQTGSPAPAAAGKPAPGAPAAPAPGRRSSVDASEGTPRDPLLNRNFDLNSPQTVPPLRGP
jgi:UPF0755 protein